MNFDRWIELITTFIAIVGGVYLTFKVLLQPVMIRLETIANNLKETGVQLRQFIKDQQDLRERLIKGDDRFREIDRRIDSLERSVKELRHQK